MANEKQLRGSGQNLPKQNKKVSLPYRPFLFTVDQISVLLDLDEKIIKREYIYFEGRSVGARFGHLLLARNIAPPDEPPEWRITERELVRFMRYRGFKYYERAVSSS